MSKVFDPIRARSSVDALEMLCRSHPECAVNVTALREELDAADEQIEQLARALRKEVEPQTFMGEPVPHPANRAARMAMDPQKLREMAASDGVRAVEAPGWEKCTEPGSWHCGSEVMGMTKDYAYRRFDNGWHRLKLPSAPKAGVMASEVRPGQPSRDERLREHAAANVAAAQLALDEAIATQRDVSGVDAARPFSSANQTAKQNQPASGVAAVEAPGCDFCRSPLFAALKCPNCGRTSGAGASLQAKALSDPPGVVAAEYDSMVKRSAGVGGTDGR